MRSAAVVAALLCNFAQRSAVACADGARVLHRPPPPQAPPLAHVFPRSQLGRVRLQNLSCRRQQVFHRKNRGLLLQLQSGGGRVGARSPARPLPPSMHRSAAHQLVRPPRTAHPCSCGPAVVDALLKIKAEQDPTLAVGVGCRIGRCGACACTIDGQNRLACQTRLPRGGTSQVRPGWLAAAQHSAAQRREHAGAVGCMQRRRRLRR